MKVALGVKTHSGWAALVALGGNRKAPQVIGRIRMELVEAADASWAKQPYHAAEHLNINEARGLVARGIESADRLAIREMQRAMALTRGMGHEPVACGVLMAPAMPGWTVDEILAVHVRMHKAEGVLFREAIARATGFCRLRLIAIPEKELEQRAERALAAPRDRLRKAVADLGRAVGPPWGKDQKDASLAAMLALASASG